MQKITSRFLTLNVQDFLKGAYVAALSAVVALIGKSFEMGHFALDWTSIWHTAAAGLVAYLTKNLFTPATAITPVQ